MTHKEYQEPISIPSKPPPSNLVNVTVNCPSCHNRNRKARRACQFCNHKGKVTKTVTRSEIED